MIRTLAADIAAKLVDRGFPVEVCYGSERLSSAVGVAGRRITIERDRRGPDNLAPFPGGQRNPRATGVRGVAVQATVHAQSTRSGALLSEHERDCDQIVDAFLVELQDWCTEAKAGAPEYVEARLLGPDDFPGGQQPPGATYRVRFRVSRAILRRDYVGNAEPTGTIGTATGTFSAVRVTRDGENFESIPLIDEG